MIKVRTYNLLVRTVRLNQGKNMFETERKPREEETISTKLLIWNTCRNKFHLQTIWQ